jgi:hypothetical protein
MFHHTYIKEHTEEDLVVVVALVMDPGMAEVATEHLVV